MDERVIQLVSRLMDACQRMLINGRSPDTVQFVYNRGIGNLSRRFGIDIDVGGL